MIDEHNEVNCIPYKIAKVGVIIKRIKILIKKKLRISDTG